METRLPVPQNNFAFTPGCSVTVCRLSILVTCAASRLDATKEFGNPLSVLTVRSYFAISSLFFVPRLTKRSNLKGKRRGKQAGN